MGAPGLACAQGYRTMRPQILSAIFRGRGLGEGGQCDGTPGRHVRCTATLGSETYSLDALRHLAQRHRDAQPLLKAPCRDQYRLIRQFDDVPSFLLWRSDFCCALRAGWANIKASLTVTMDWGTYLMNRGCKIGGAQVLVARHCSGIWHSRHGGGGGSPDVSDVQELENLAI